MASNHNSPDNDEIVAGSSGMRPAAATRSRAGCLTCRARKVRCDGFPSESRSNGATSSSSSSCGRCERLGLQCVMSNNGSLSQMERAEMSSNAARRRDLNQAGFVRLRSAASCNYCRSRRQKCSGERPTCARCLETKRECVYDRRQEEARRDSGTTASAPGSAATSSSAAGIAAHDLSASAAAGVAGTTAASSAASSIPLRSSSSTASPSTSNDLSLVSTTGAAATTNNNNNNLTTTTTNNTTTTTTTSSSTASLGLPGHVVTTPSLSPRPGLDLQNVSLVRALVDAFFREIAPLRCFGFIHEPSFIQRMDTFLGTQEQDPLLMSVCALATKGVHKDSLREQGSAWAQAALQLVLGNMHRMSVNLLMCIVLLHEHFARVDELRVCFMLSSMACRICQALQLNVEYDLDFACESSPLSATEKETRRRLMWACYIIDVSTAAGVDSLRLLREEHVQIQLPSDEESFYYRTAGLTSFLPSVGQLGYPTELSGSQSTRRTLVGHRAYYVQMVVHRERALLYLKRRTPEDSPSAPLSEFNILVADLERWKSSLPPNVQMNSEVVYIRKSRGTLSALLDLHMAFHQCACDLYRIMTPPLLMPPRQHNNMTDTAPPDYLHNGRRKWYEHACALTNIFSLALEHAPESMNEPATSICGYTAIRTKLYYLLYVMSDEERQAQAHFVDHLVSIDLKYLRTLNHLHPVVARTLACSEELVRTLDPLNGGAAAAIGPVNGNKEQRHENNNNNSCDPDLPPSATQVSADYRLHPLATFRIIRNEITEKHTPEKTYNAVQPGLVPSAPLFTASADSQLFDALWNMDESSYGWLNNVSMPEQHHQPQPQHQHHHAAAAHHHHYLHTSADVL